MCLEIFMAVLTYPELKKYDSRILAFVDRVNNKGAFTHMTESGAVLKCTGKAEILVDGKKNKVKLTTKILSNFLDNKKTGDNLFIECTKDSHISKKMYKPQEFFKDKEMGGAASKSSGLGSERQELGLIDFINTTILKNTQSWVAGIGRTENLLRAEKREGLSSVGQEPYIDVYVTTNKKKYGISCKGKSAPSLAGGGIAGLNVVVPDLLPKMYARIEKQLKKMGYTEGAIVNIKSLPEFWIEIPDEYVEKVLVGNRKMGGPIDYMYVGEMDVRGELKSTGEISLNGDFISIADYMKKVPIFYFRIRRRDVGPDGNVKISFKKKNQQGFPIVFMGPVSGKNNFRLVIAGSPPTTAVTMKL
jgi:hypothetical protein